MDTTQANRYMRGLLLLLLGVVIGFTLAVVIVRTEYEACLRANPVPAPANLMEDAGIRK